MLRAFAPVAWASAAALRESDSSRGPPAARDLRLLLRSESEGRIEAVAGSFGDAAASYFAMILDNEPDVNLEALDCSKVEDGMECTRTAFGNAGGSHGDATGDAGQPFGDARDRQ